MAFGDGDVSIDGKLGDALDSGAEEMPHYFCSVDLRIGTNTLEKAAAFGPINTFSLDHELRRAQKLPNRFRVGW